MFSEIMTDRIVGEMQRKGVSKTDLSDALGVSDVAVGYWCHGKRSPSLQQVVAMAEYFGVSVDYLIGRSDFPGRAPTLADDVGLTDEAIANMRSIASDPDKKLMLNRLLQFEGLSPVIADIIKVRNLRREIPGSIHTANLTDEIIREVDEAGYVLLDNEQSADYLEQHAVNCLKIAFRLSDGRRF